MIRTSWVIGDGGNFVRTMASLAERGVDPRVVDDQVGRLTFTVDIAAAIRHLLHVSAPSGVYNVTGSGNAATWCDVAREVFRLTGHDPDRVAGISTEEYFAAAKAPISPRPRNSVLDLTRVRAQGVNTPDWPRSLETYLRSS